METVYFFFSILKALGIIAGVSAVLGFLCLIFVYIIDVKNIRENYTGLSSTLGNALFIIHSMFEPGRKPQSEQVIWVKKRRTRVEKGILGLDSLNYDKLSIIGYRKINDVRYVRKKEI